MSVNTPSNTSTAPAPVDRTQVRDDERGTERGTQTKSAFKTTEFMVYLFSVVAVLVASNLVDDSAGRGDVFLADKAWLFITMLTIGYMVSRGLAKCGSRKH